MSDPENVSYHTINETVSSKSSTEEGNYNFYLTSKSSYTIHNVIWPKSICR